MSSEKSISVIMPCYKDAGSVEEAYHRLSSILPQLTRNYEIIYVNDASPDNAEDILTQIAEKDPHVVVINHTRNFGSQNAFFSGMMIAKGEAVILMDGDLQDPPSLIPDFYRKWLEGYHIVYGVRVKRRETLFRQIAYKAFYRLFRRMSEIPVPVDVGDFGLMDRRVVEILLTEFPERNIFLRGLRAYTGFKHTGVEYIREERFDGVSTNSLKGNIRWAKLGILSFSKRPLEFISNLAMTLVAITVLSGLFYLGSYISSLLGYKNPPPSGFMTQLIMILFFGTANLICISIISEYVGHIFTEVKRRPRFVIRDVIDNRNKSGDKTTKEDF